MQHSCDSTAVESFWVVNDVQADTEVANSVAQVAALLAQLRLVGIRKTTIVDLLESAIGGHPVSTPKGFLRCALSKPGHPTTNAEIHERTRWN